MSCYFLTAGRSTRRQDQRPILENAGRAARLAKWWHGACEDAWRDDSRSDLDGLQKLTFEVASDPRSLARAFAYLRAHGGQAPGPEGVTYDDLLRCGIWDAVRQISVALRSGEYQITPPKLIRIKKRDGSDRQISLFEVDDRVVSRAVATTLTPLLAPGFTDAAYGGLPGRGPAAAFVRIFNEMSAIDRPFWITADIRAAFDNVPRRRLLNLFNRFPRPMVELLEQLVQTHRRHGFAQGLPTSPLLLHVYLDHFVDQPFARKFPEMPLIRYMDDFLVLARSRKDAELAFKHLDRLVRDSGLNLKPGAQLTDIRDTPAQWLGMSFRAGNYYLIDATILEDAWLSLAERLRRCQIEGRDGQAVVNGWLAYHAIAYRREIAADVVRRVRRMCESFSIAPPSAKELREHWRDSWLRICEQAGGYVLRISR